MPSPQSTIYLFLVLPTITPLVHCQGINFGTTRSSQTQNPLIGGINFGVTSSNKPVLPSGELTCTQLCVQRNLGTIVGVDLIGLCSRYPALGFCLQFECKLSPVVLQHCNKGLEYDQVKNMSQSAGSNVSTASGGYGGLVPVYGNNAAINFATTRSSMLNTGSEGRGNGGINFGTKGPLMMTLQPNQQASLECVQNCVLRYVGTTMNVNLIGLCYKYPPMEPCLQFECYMPPSVINPCKSAMPEGGGEYVESTQRPGTRVVTGELPQYTYAWDTLQKQRDNTNSASSLWTAWHVQYFMLLWLCKCTLINEKC